MRQTASSATIKASIIAYTRSLTHSSDASELGPGWRGVSFRGELQTDLASQGDASSQGGELQQEPCTSPRSMYESLDDSFVADTGSSSSSGGGEEELTAAPLSSIAIAPPLHPNKAE